MPTVRLVTGIKPSGTIHLGNHVGMLRQTRRAAASADVRCFVADLHALNTHPRPDALRAATADVERVLVAAGLADAGVVLYRQSDVPEFAELAAILASACAKGLLNRAHAYRARVAENAALGRAPDDGINAGLYGYPLLMAADILGVAATHVPVGADQAQHVEIARAIAGAVNARLGPVLVEPEARLDPQAMLVPGRDGRKMSKSSGNLLPIVASRAEIDAFCRGIVTSSAPLGTPLDPDACPLVALLRAVADAPTVAAVEAAYRDGGAAYGATKRLLAEAIDAELSPLRARHAETGADEAARIVDAGAERARDEAAAVLGAVRRAVGLPARGARGRPAP